MGWVESPINAIARTIAGEGNYEAYATTSLYVERPFSSDVTTITITNDDTAQNIQFSYDGATLEGELRPAETVTVQTTVREKIYVKSDTGGAVCRIWGW